jgi:hypothetical protein
VKQLEEVAGGWRRLHNEEPQNLYGSPNVIRVMTQIRMRWTGHVELMGEINAYKVFVGKHEGKEPLGRPGRRWEYNIRMNLWQVMWERVDWMLLAQDRDQW